MSGHSGHEPLEKSVTRVTSTSKNFYTVNGHPKELVFPLETPEIEKPVNQAQENVETCCYLPIGRIFELFPSKKSKCDE